MKKLFKTIIIALIWTAVWFCAAALVGSEILLPSPVQTLKALFFLIGDGKFYISVLMSVIRILCGFLCGTALGILLGVLTFRFSFLRSLFAPVMSIVKATPVASFIVLLFVWFSNGTVASVTSLLIVLPIIWSNVFTSLGSVDEKLIEMAQVFKVPTKKVVKDIYIPSVFTSFKSAAATALGLAWKAGIAAEVICNPKNSIGGGIYSSKVYLDTPSLFAWTLVVIVVSVLIEKLVFKLLRIKKEAAL